MADVLDLHGTRLYLASYNASGFRSPTMPVAFEVRTFCTVLHDTGARISEVIAATPPAINYGTQTIIFETLKKRRKGIYRGVPVPEGTLDSLDMVHGIRERQKRKEEGGIRDWSRKTAYTRVKEAMAAAGLEGGPHACPKGLRHGFGVHAISSGVPLNMLSKWMGHASLEVTAIYANAQGEEQRSIAARMWS